MQNTKPAMSERYALTRREKYVLWARKKGIQVRRLPDANDVAGLLAAINSGLYPMTLHPCGTIECANGMCVKKQYIWSERVAFTDTRE